jgi:hypothetical protein
MLANDEQKRLLVQQIECLFLSCPLDYRIDTDHKDLHPVAQPQAKQYSCLVSLLRGRRSESETENMQSVPAAFEKP